MTDSISEIVRHLQNMVDYPRSHFNYVDDRIMVKCAIEALTRSSAAMERALKDRKELSDALLTVRPLGGSELFVRRGDTHIADARYCAAAIKADAESRHNALRQAILAERRALAAEARLKEATEALQFIADGYDNQDVNHVDYRVKVYQVATDFLSQEETADE